MATTRKVPTGEKHLAAAEVNGYLTIAKGQPYGETFVAAWRERCERQGRPAIHAVVRPYSARVVAVFDHLGGIDPSQAREIAFTLHGVEDDPRHFVRYFGGEFEYTRGEVVVRQRPEIEAHCSPAVVRE